jgi:hypothetical protein
MRPTLAMAVLPTVATATWQPKRDLTTEVPQPRHNDVWHSATRQNIKVTTSFEFVTLCPAALEPLELWAKGDLNPHVPKDTGT